MRGGENGRRNWHGGNIAREKSKFRERGKVTGDGGNIAREKSNDDDGSG